ncbi:Furin-like protease 2 [Papilio machaon]|uniref:Furin-like protease 2 n=1 Tax=Papilio machaon TaxID=76193 RepID=A0A194R7W8_PAPMA|nr:Furin-like protease 2 [Papilio machaon]
MVSSLGFYQSVGGCRRCHHYCRECDGSGPLHCRSCPPRFMLDGGLCMECLGSQYYEPSTGVCLSCDNSCRTCSGPGRFSCSGCSRPLRLDRLNNQCVPCCSERGAYGNSSASECCHCNMDTGECINSSVAGKRRIAEWGALQRERAPAPSAAAVALTVCAAAAAVFLAVLFVLQIYHCCFSKLKPMLSMLRWS